MDLRDLEELREFKDFIPCCLLASAWTDFSMPTYVGAKPYDMHRSDVIDHLYQSILCSNKIGIEMAEMANSGILLKRM